MAAMAAMVQVATQGHFAAVIVSVDKQLEELRQEEQDDINLRDYCQAEEIKTEHEIEDLTHEMAATQSLIDRLDAKKQETNAEKNQAEADIGTTEDAMAEALATRTQENEDFQLALATRTQENEDF